MKAKKFLPIALIAVALLFIMAVFADLNGKWTGIIKIPGGDDLNVTYTFKVDGNKLTGVATSPSGDVSIDNGKVDGDKFSFSVNVGGTDYPHTGKLYADSCGIDIDFGGMKVHTKVLRTK